MAQPIRFLMLGGFLGAGKTTTIARLANHYIQSGLKVGIVTNDQAHHLVDTESLRAQGFDVGEVPGACFCCKFNDLVETAQRLAEDQLPDVILTEPVGSCTDLVATVVQPLRALYAERYQMGPLAVLLKPEHGRKILGDGGELGFSQKAAYIFLKQIEEADIVVINKIDKMSDDARLELEQRVLERFPDKRVISISARDGQGIDQLVSALDGQRDDKVDYMEVDYEVYAEGEAELGWLNCQVQVQSQDDQRFDLDQLVLTLVQQLAVGLEQAHGEPAHLKILGQVDADAAVANLVAADEPPELSLASEVKVTQADLLINARVAASPEDLDALVREVVKRVSQDMRLKSEVTGMQRFRPAPPVPTHRYGTDE